MLEISKDWTCLVLESRVGKRASLVLTLVGGGDLGIVTVCHTALRGEVVGRWRRRLWLLEPLLGE